MTFVYLLDLVKDKTGVSQKIIVWTYLKRDATPTFLLDGVIFDVIGDSKSLNANFSK